MKTACIFAVVTEPHRHVKLVIHIHRVKRRQGRRSCAYFITVSPEDSSLLGKGINGDGFRRFDACEIHPMSFPS